MSPNYYYEYMKGDGSTLFMSTKVVGIEFNIAQREFLHICMILLDLFVINRTGGVSIIL